MEEIWEKIVYKGAETEYLISNFANVKSIKWGREKNIKPRKDRHGYWLIRMRINGEEHRIFLHKTVGLHFIPNPENKTQVNHIDGVKEHCYISNLEWVTPKENVNHAVRMGLIKYKKGALHHNSKSIRAISIDGKEIRTYGSMNEATKDGFSEGNISNCCKGKRISHKGFTWQYAEIDEIRTMPIYDIKKLKRIKRGSDAPNSRKIIQMKDGEIIRTYDFIRQVKNYGFCPTHASQCAKGIRMTHKNFQWKFVS